MSIAIVTLRTGAEVPEPVVKTTLIALARLENAHPIALFEAVEVARDKTHVPFGNTGDILAEFNLLEHDGTMHSATRDVILASIKGYDEFDHRLVSPYAKKATS